MDDVTAELTALREAALAEIGELPEGDGLEPLTAAYVAFGVASCATTLDEEGMRTAAAQALGLGASLQELTEVAVLVSAVGMHSLHEGARVLNDVAGEEGIPMPEPAEPDAEYWRGLLSDPYWQGLVKQLPGFAEPMLGLSPEAFRGFVAYCAIPWTNGTLPAKVKELVYLGIDSTPSHRYGPGFRVHLGNAISLGATRSEILEVLDIAAAAGPPRGVA